MIEPKIGQIWVQKYWSGITNGSDCSNLPKHGILVYNYDSKKDEILHLYMEEVEYWDYPTVSCFRLSLNSIPRLDLHTTGQGICTLKQLNDNYILDTKSFYKGRSD